MPKKARGKCATKYCRNKAAVGRTLCHKCKQRRFRESHPKKAAYANLKAKAIYRKIKFTLTLEQFEKIAEGTEAFDKEGNRNGDYHFDRIDATRGYEVGNVQVLHSSENISKGNKERTQEYYIYKYYERKYGRIEAEKMRAAAESGPAYIEEFDEERPFG